MPSEEVPGVQEDTTDRALARAAAAAPPVWDLEAEAVGAAVAGGAGRDLERGIEI